MIEEGSIININNKQGVACIVDVVNDTKYVNISFDNNEYEIYKIESKEDGEYLVLETNEKIIGNLIAKWTIGILENENEGKE